MKMLIDPCGYIIYYSYFTRWQFLDTESARQGSGGLELLHGQPWDIWLFNYCNRRNIRTHKKFALQRSRSRAFVRYKFPYSEDGVTFTVNTCMVFVCYFKFRTFSRKYEKDEIKSRTKISAITVLEDYWLKPIADKKHTSTTTTTTTITTTMTITTTTTTTTTSMTTTLVEVAWSSKD